MDALCSAEVWPCCWTAVLVFIDMSGQWRIGLNGATALDYNVLPFILEMHRQPREAWPQLFADLSVMERAALEIFREGGNG
jgi:hypothetical protein